MSRRALCFLNTLTAYHRASAQLAQYEESKRKFNVEKFSIYMAHNQVLLFPAFNLQQALQRKVCGTGFWTKQTKRRHSLCGGEYVSIAKLLVMVSPS